jgi:putative transcriptional regulator
MRIVVGKSIGRLCAKDIFDELSINAPEPIHSDLHRRPGALRRAFILRPPFAWEASLSVTATLGLSNTRDILEAIAGGRGPGSFLISLGCAGWGPGQLEDEIKDNAWLTQPVFEENIFVLPVEVRWAEALKKMGWTDPAECCRACVELILKTPSKAQWLLASRFESSNCRVCPFRSAVIMADRGFTNGSELRPSVFLVLRLFLLDRPCLGEQMHRRLGL